MSTFSGRNFDAKMLESVTIRRFDGADIVEVYRPKGDA